MWREEDYGSEWWAYSRPFKAPEETHKIKSLGADIMEETLEEIHAAE